MLDRVICCYHDMPTLVELSASWAWKVYGLVCPPEAWWIRLGIHLENLTYRLRGSPFQSFVHKSQAVEVILQKHGLQRRYYARTRNAGSARVNIY